VIIHASHALSLRNQKLGNVDIVSFFPLIAPKAKKRNPSRSIAFSGSRCVIVVYPRLAGHNKSLNLGEEARMCLIREDLPDRARIWINRPLGLINDSSPPQ
jgi:hypothetical protein